MKFMRDVVLVFCFKFFLILLFLGLVVLLRFVWMCVVFFFFGVISILVGFKVFVWG